MKRKSKKPAVHKNSRKEKEFEALLQRAADLSKKKAGRKAARAAL